MAIEGIAEVGLDRDGRLFVRPRQGAYPMVYRAGMQVYWDEHHARLFSPKPIEWSYLDWYKQIIAAVRSEYGVVLRIDGGTIWTDVSDALQSEIRSV